MSIGKSSPTLESYPGLLLKRDGISVALEVS